MNSSSHSSQARLDQLLILMYHRIAEPDLDPWKLCVSPENFTQHLERLSQRYDFIKLSEIPACGDLKHKVVITFDDGYLDNFLLAKPILEKFSAPATVFVTTGYIGGEREFWWDELEQLTLMPGDLPRTLSLNVAGVQCQFEFREYHHYSDEMADSHRHWKVTYDGTPPPTERHALFMNLWEKLKQSPEAARRSVIKYLFDWAGLEPTVRPTHRPMKQGELAQITRGGHIEIGSHCVTHGSLSAMELDEQSSEINTSKQSLESILGVRIRCLAYPHGEYDRVICEMTRNAGYNCAVGTTKYRVSDFDKRFQLRRRQAPNVPGDVFEARVLGIGAG